MSFWGCSKQEKSRSRNDYVGRTGTPEISKATKKAGRRIDDAANRRLLSVLLLAPTKSGQEELAPPAPCSEVPIADQIGLDVSESIGLAGDHH